MTTHNPYTFRVRFWGVRGSTPTPMADHMKYGGNTPCVEVETQNGTIIILDGGTGLRLLGDALISRAKATGTAIQANLLLSHFHWDHIQGFPFFRPIYSDQNSFTIGAALPETQFLKLAFQGQFIYPYFPVLHSQLGAKIEFFQFSQDPVEFHDVHLSSRRLNHPQGCSGFRLELNSRVLVYATDHEHGNPEADRAVRELARGASLLISDAQYTPEEYSHGKAGWGHSTWPDVISIARDANVKELVLTHHDPWRNDEGLAEIEEKAKAEFPNCRTAREGMEILL